jgi:hypothetical protein
MNNDKKEVKITEEQQIELNINQNMLILIDRCNELLFSLLLTNDEKIKYLQQLFNGLGVNKSDEYKVTLTKKQVD